LLYLLVIAVCSAELVLNRFTLRASYPLRFYLDAAVAGQHKGGDLHLLPFDQAQAQLEVSTEALSGRIARKRLNSPRREVVQAALQARQVREQFGRAASAVARFISGLPPLTSPQYTSTSFSSSSSSSSPKSWATPRQAAGPSKHCGVCTYQNLSTAPLCEMCASPLGAENTAGTRGLQVAMRALLAKPQKSSSRGTRGALPRAATVTIPGTGGSVACPACTFVNTPGAAVCAMCNGKL